MPLAWELSAWPKALSGSPHNQPGPGDESEAVDRSFLLDLEEMSKAFSDLQALKWFKKGSPQGTLGPVGCGGRIPGRVGPLLYTIKEGAGCAGMMDHCSRVGEQRSLGCVLSSA